MSIETILHSLATVSPDDSRRGAVESAAERVGVSPATAYRWIESGGVPKSRHLLAILQAQHGSDAATVPLSAVRDIVGSCADD